MHVLTNEGIIIYIGQSLEQRADGGWLLGGGKVAFNLDSYPDVDIPVRITTGDTYDGNVFTSKPLPPLDPEEVLLTEMEDDPRLVFSDTEKRDQFLRILAKRIRQRR